MNVTAPTLVEEANARLRELGYAPEEAQAARRLRGIRLHGSLVEEVVIERERVHAVLAMLPPKARLLAVRQATRALHRRVLD